MNLICTVFRLESKEDLTVILNCLPSICCVCMSPPPTHPLKGRWGRKCLQKVNVYGVFFLLKMTLELNCVLGEKMGLEIILKETKPSLRTIISRQNHNK